MNQPQSTKAANGTEVLERERTRGGPTYRPDVDIYETQDEIALVADVPGAAAGDVDLRFENGVLDLRVAVRPRRPGDAPYLAQEFGIGDFYRTFQVTEDVDPGRISAEINDGVLTVHLPKAESAKPRRIEVRASTAATAGTAATGGKGGTGGAGQ